MNMQEQEQFLNLGEPALDQKPAMVFSSVESVVEHLQQKQAAFLGMLQTIGSEDRYLLLPDQGINVEEKKRKRIGWDLIDQDGSFAMLGLDPNPHTHEVFTGQRMCTVATFALYDGLQGMLGDSPQVSVLSANVFFNKKFPRALFDQEVFGLHVFLVLKDMGGDSETVLIDPTYGQIDPKWAGQFLIADLGKIGKYYTASSNNGISAVPNKHPTTIDEAKDTTGGKKADLDFYLKQMAITQEAYDMLVQTIANS